MSFDYVEPTSVDEATRLLSELEDAALLAGGTSFTLLWRTGLARPGAVIGLRRLTELRDISADDAGMWIGALATHRAVELSPIVAERHPVLVDTFRSIATVRIRNQATVGGNLAHADPAQDPPPALIALDAVAEIAGPNGVRRKVPIDEFFVSYFETVLEPEELLLGVRIPPAIEGTRSTYHKFLPRTADDYCTVSVAASVRSESGHIVHARVALGGAAPVPVRARTVEAALVGQPATAATIRAAAAQVDVDIDPLSDHRGHADYKRRMARVWVERALTKVTD